MRCVTANLYDADDTWRFHEIATQEHAHWIKRLRVWRQLDSKDEALCTVLDDLLVSWEQNHEMHTLLLFVRGGTRLDAVAKFVSGVLDPSFCWVGAFVVAPHMRNQGLGTFYWRLTRTFIVRTHKRVQRISLTPLEGSKGFWKRSCGFAPLAADTLGSVIKNGGVFADAPLHGIEVWELDVSK